MAWQSSWQRALVLGPGARFGKKSSSSSELGLQRPAVKSAHSAGRSLPPWRGNPLAKEKAGRSLPLGPGNRFAKEMEARRRDVARIWIILFELRMGDCEL